MKARGARQLAALVVVFVAGLASLATSPAARDEDSGLEFTVALPASNPVAARRVDVSIARGDAPIERATLEASSGYDEYGNSSDISISIVPDDPSEALLPPKRELFDFALGITQDLTTLCREGCARSYTIIVRSNSIFDVNAIVSLYVFADASATASASSDPPVVTIALSDEQPEGGIATATASAPAVLDADLFGSGSWHGTISIPAAANDALAGRVFGSLTISGRSEFDGDDAAADIWVSINGESRHAARVRRDADPLAIEREWLSHCAPGVSCSVPIDVDLRWSPYTFFGLNIWLVPGHVHSKLSIEARLEYVGRPDTPPGTTIELIPD